MDFRYSPLSRYLFLNRGIFNVPTYWAAVVTALFGLAALPGCTKEECDGSCIEVRGRVGSEANSAVLVPGADIQLNSIGNGGSFFSAPEIPIKRIRSSADGTYSLTFVPTKEMQQRGRYRLIYSKEGYGDESLGLNVTRGYAVDLQLVPGGTYEKNLHLPRLGGYLRLRITGFPGGSATNSTYLSVYSGLAGVGYAGTGMDVSFYDTATGQGAGRSNDLTDVTCQTAGNQYAVVQIYKLKAGVRTTIRDSIYCPVNTPVTYTHTF